MLPMVRRSSFVFGAGIGDRGLFGEVFHKEVFVVSRQSKRFLLLAMLLWVSTAYFVYLFNDVVASSKAAINFSTLREPRLMK